MPKSTIDQNTNITVNEFDIKDVLKFKEWWRKKETKK
jgi:hypothetical protein